MQVLKSYQKTRSAGMYSLYALRFVIRRWTGAPPAVHDENEIPRICAMFPKNFLLFSVSREYSASSPTATFLPDLSPFVSHSIMLSMAFLSWCSRRVGGLSLLALGFLCSWVLLNEIRSTRSDTTEYAAGSSHQFSFEKAHRGQRASAISPVIFAYYSLFIHVLVTIFPFRACWAIWDVTRDLRKVAGSGSKKLKSLEAARKLSSSSLSSAETLTPSSPSSSTASDTEDFDSEYYADVDSDVRRPIHAVLIPNYKEDIDVLRETLDVLASHPQARRRYDVRSLSEKGLISCGTTWNSKCSLSDISCDGGPRVEQRCESVGLDFHLCQEVPLH
jgi:hypothetical protein